MPYANSEVRRVYNLAYAKKHKEQLKAYHAEYRKKHREENIEYLREWKEEHPDYDREWQKNHRANKNASQRLWVKKNLSKVKALSAKRAARIAKSGGSFTSTEWETLQRKYHNRCVGCGLSEMQIKTLKRSLVPDHVIPVSKGGTSNISNIQPLCHCYKRGSRGGCNNRKRDTVIDYR